MAPESGLRPLSVRGEGYCTACQFIVGLDRLGRLAAHVRGAHGMTPRTCKGGGRKPARVIPWASRKAAFRTRVEMGQCRTCSRRLRLDPKGLLARHPSNIYHPYGPPCEGSGSLPL